MRDAPVVMVPMNNSQEVGHIWTSAVSFQLTNASINLKLETKVFAFCYFEMGLLLLEAFPEICVKYNFKLLLSCFILHKFGESNFCLFF